MRQRLLLSAGWVVAVVGSGLVASGAVAIAGGQVLDRPLRPLTAAEVAALPVVGMATDPDPIEPQASGGSASTSGEDASGSASEETARTGPTGPVGAGGVPADGPARSPDSAVDLSNQDGTEPVVGPVDPRAGGDLSDSAVAHLAGGSAAVAAYGERITLLWATPRPGYVAELRFETDDRLTLTFQSTHRGYAVSVTLVDGQIVVDTAEESFR